MTVLVTGATGCLGSHLVERLIGTGTDVRVLLRRHSRRDLIPACAETVIGDLRDKDSLRRAVAGADLIYHCAARVVEGGSWSEFDDHNIRGTEQLLSAAAAAGVRRFVHVSSVGVYGPSKTGSRRISEDEGYDPYPWRRGYYTWSKIESDRLALRYGSENALNTVVVRPGILWGLRAKPFVARMHISLKNGWQLIVGSPRLLLPLVHVQSVVSGLCLIGQGKGESGQAYNLVDEPMMQRDYLRQCMDGRKQSAIFYVPAAWARVAGGLLDCLGGQFRRQPRFLTYRLLRVSHSIIYDTSKAERELGWHPMLPFSREDSQCH